MVRTFLNHIELDDYDLLIQLCDAIALPEGPVSMEKRLRDIEERYGSYPEDKRQRCYELKAYLEEKMGRSLYDVIGVDEITLP